MLLHGRVIESYVLYYCWTLSRQFTLSLFTTIVDPLFTVSKRFVVGKSAIILETYYYGNDQTLTNYTLTIS